MNWRGLTSNKTLNRFIIVRQSSWIWTSMFVNIIGGVVRKNIPLRDDWADWADYSDYIWWNWWCLRHGRYCDSIINLANLLNPFNRPKGACCIEEHKCLYVKDWCRLTYQLTGIDVKEKRVLMIYSTSTFSSPVGQSSWIETSMFVNIIGGVYSRKDHRCSRYAEAVFVVPREPR